MKHVSFLFASLLLLVGQSVYAQAPDAEPEPEVSDDVDDEIDEAAEEAEEEDPAPGSVEEQVEEAEEAEAEEETEAAANLGQNLTAPGTPTAAMDASALEAEAEDAGEPEGQAAAEARARAVAAEERAEEVSEEEPSTADRLAQANPNSGLPWALPITWTQSLGAGSFNRATYLTYNPTYAWNFTAVPRWNFSSGVSVGLLQSVDIELTQSDFTTRDKQLWWGDTRLDVTYTLPWKPWGTLIIPSVLISAPTSLISRAADRYLGTGGRLLFIKPLPILGGLILGGGISYTYWIGAHNGGASTETGYPCQRASAEGEGNTPSANCGVVPSATPVRHVLSGGLFGTLIPAAGWQINLSFTAIYNKGDNLDEACVDTLSGQHCEGDNSPNNHWRTLTSFGFSFGYDVTSYMTLSLGYSTLASHPDSEGEASEGFPMENPFYNENTQVTLSLQFRVDGLVVHRMAKNAEAEAREAEAAAEEAANDALRAVAF